MEEEILKRTKVNLNKLESYGFQKVKNIYQYSKKFMDDFEAQITIDEEGNVLGKVYDLGVEEEYINFRVQNQKGEFVSKVREEYKKILEDIKENCFEKSYFVFSQSNRITKYIIQKYGNEPEFLWDKIPLAGVFRNNKNQKWYGIIMYLDRSKLENKNGSVEILNLKAEEKSVQEFIRNKGFFEAYHMNKKNWFTIILDDTIEDEIIYNLIDESYRLIDTSKKKVRKQREEDL